ncbi:MAG: hypothetical protein WD046_08120 [Paracoccaceae bacterium]
MPKQPRMKNLMRCAVVALMLAPAATFAQTVELKPLNELLETAAAPYPSTRCAGWYQALMEWGGKRRFGAEAWEDMDTSRRNLILYSSLIFNQASGNSYEVDVGLTSGNVRHVADTYLERMRGDYIATGEAFGQDELIKSDISTCRIVAVQAFSVLSSIGQ